MNEDAAVERLIVDAVRSGDPQRLMAAASDAADSGARDDALTAADWLLEAMDTLGRALYPIAAPRGSARPDTNPDTEFALAVDGMLMWRSPADLKVLRNADAGATGSAAAAVLAAWDRLLRAGAELNVTTAAFEIGPLVVDLNEHDAWIAARACGLTDLESGVLEVLVAHAGRVVPAEELGRVVWNGPVPRASLTTTVSTLRRKLVAAGGDAAWIQPVPTLGYRHAAAFEMGGVPAPTKAAEGRVFIDWTARRAWRGARELELGLRELELLAVLVERAGLIVPRATVRERWSGTPTNLNSTLATLRAKLGDPDPIETTADGGLCLHPLPPRRRR